MRPYPRELRDRALAEVQAIVDDRHEIVVRQLGRMLADRDEALAETQTHRDNLTKQLDDALAENTKLRNEIAAAAAQIAAIRDELGLDPLLGAP